ncbi:peptidoglycan-binding protein [Nostoc sp.]|uniref:peptidoglycan-binding protein n=1 Tax=Nostoc sp. TaxID=1180 RepID=UPI002FF835BD
MTKVKDIINKCDTGLSKGLNLQIIAVINTIVPNLLVNFDDLDVDVSGDQINPYLQPAAKESLRLAIKERGKQLVVNSAYRTVAQQYLIRKQYERNLCGITAAAYPGSSNHEGGLALDIEHADDWQQFFERHNWFRLGRDFDFPHYDYKFPAATRRDLGKIGIIAFQKLWNQFNPKDRILEDGDYGPQTEARLADSPAEGFKVIPVRTLGLTNPPMQGDDVKKVQAALLNAKIAKIDIKVTGIFDVPTENAVKQFQEATKRLSVDGRVGETTLKALGL